MTRDELQEVHDIVVACWKDYMKHSAVVGTTTEESLPYWNDYVEKVEERTKAFGNNQFQRKLDALFMADLERRALEHMESDK